MRKSPAYAAFLAAALVACGTTENTETPPETPTLEDPAAYFGMERCTCYEFRSEDPLDDRRLGVAVEAVSDLYSPGTPWHFVRYRSGGRLLRQDFVIPTDPDLELHGLTFRDSQDNEQFWRLDEPLAQIRFPADGEQQVVYDGTVKRDGEEISFQMTSDYVPQVVENVSFDGTDREDVEAVRISYAGVPWADDNLDRWFVPNRGLVRIEMQIEGARKTFVLDRKRTLGNDCPNWEPNSIKDTCGADTDF